MYDPATGKITLIRTCFSTHHLIFAEDANNTLWASAGGPASGVVGWINMQAQVDVLKSDIKSFTVADAQGKDDKQISDINAFVSSGNCDALIVSPNTTAALTPTTSRK